MTGFSGGCLCGAIHYECSEAPVSMVRCHCRACQRTGGAGHSPTVVVRREALRVIRGEAKSYRRAADSGAIATREFCGQCGAPLFAWSSSRPQFVGIRAGSLNDPSWFEPERSVYAEDAQPWDVVEANVTPREKT